MQVEQRVKRKLEGYTPYMQRPQKSRNLFVRFADLLSEHYFVANFSAVLTVALALLPLVLISFVSSISPYNMWLAGSFILLASLISELLGFSPRALHLPLFNYALGMLSYQSCVSFGAWGVLSLLFVLPVILLSLLFAVEDLGWKSAFKNLEKVEQNDPANETNFTLLYESFCVPTLLGRRRDLCLHNLYVLDRISTCHNKQFAAVELDELSKLLEQMCDFLDELIERVDTHVYVGVKELLGRKIVAVKE